MERKDTTNGTQGYYQCNVRIQPIIDRSANEESILEEYCLASLDMMFGPDVFPATPIIPTPCATHLVFQAKKEMEHDRNGVFPETFA